MIGTSATTDDGLMMSVCLYVCQSAGSVQMCPDGWNLGEIQFSLNEICNGSFPP